MYLVTLMLCAIHVVYSADFIMSDDLFSNEFNTPLNVADFSDMTLAGGDGQVVNLNANFSLLGLQFDVLTVMFIFVYLKTFTIIKKLITFTNLFGYI